MLIWKKGISGTQEGAAGYMVSMALMRFHCSPKVWLLSLLFFFHKLITRTSGFQRWWGRPRRPGKWRRWKGSRLDLRAGWQNVWLLSYGNLACDNSKERSREAVGMQVWRNYGGNSGNKELSCWSYKEHKEKEGKCKLSSQRCPLDTVMSQQSQIDPNRLKYWAPCQ